MNQLLLNIKGVSCAAINAGIKHAQNSSANSKIEDAEKLDLSIVSFGQIFDSISRIITIVSIINTKNRF
jgi:hypothetical protein